MTILISLGGTTPKSTLTFELIDNKVYVSSDSFNESVFSEYFDVDEVEKFAKDLQRALAVNKILYNEQ